MTFTLGIVIAVAAPSAGVADAQSSSTGAHAAPRVVRVTHVREHDALVDITYEGAPLRAPFDARALGVQLEQLVEHVGAPPAAVVRIVVRSASGATHIERRIVRAGDDLLGAQVIDVLEAGVLLAYDGALFFAHDGRRPSPTFRLSWQSSFTLSYPSPVVAPPPPSSKKRRAR